VLYTFQFFALIDKLPFIQSNYLTAARYDYDVSEKRIIYHILLKLKNDLFSQIDDATLKKDMDIIISETQLRKTDSNENYLRDYRKAVKRLRERSFSIELPDEGWIETGFLLRGQYRKGIGLELTISRDIIGYLWDLSRGFTAMDATVAITLHSKYAQRFYEWCCRWRDIGHFAYTPDGVRQALGITQPTKWLKQFVLEVAERGIKELYDTGLSDLYFTYEEKRGGRGRGGTVLKWNFVVHTRTAVQKQKAQHNDMAFVMNTLKGIYDGQPAVADGILAVVSTDHETMKDFANRLGSILTKHRTKPIRNLGGYIRTVARDEYGFEEMRQGGEPVQDATPKSKSEPQRISDFILPLKGKKPN
jgi:plasmid replication initiation protein